jgi:hypothetical protein
VARDDVGAGAAEYGAMIAARKLRRPVRTCQNRLGTDKSGAPLLCGKPATRRRFYWWLCQACATSARWLDAEAAGVLERAL